MNLLNEILQHRENMNNLFHYDRRSIALVLTFSPTIVISEVIYFEIKIYLIISDAFVVTRQILI